MNFTADQVQELWGPGVYIYRSGVEIIYVGASAYGLGRAFGSSHKVRRKAALWELKPTLEFIPCGTASDAFVLEIALIKQHKPKYNVTIGGAPTYVAA